MKRLALAAFAAVISGGASAQDPLQFANGWQKDSRAFHVELQRVTKYARVAAQTRQDMALSELHRQARQIYLRSFNLPDSPNGVTPACHTAADHLYKATEHLKAGTAADRLEGTERLELAAAWGDECIAAINRR